MIESEAVPNKIAQMGERKYSSALPALKLLASYDPQTLEEPYPLQTAREEREGNAASLARNLSIQKKASVIPLCSPNRSSYLLID